MTVQPYAVIATVSTVVTNFDGSTTTVPAGTVLNRVQWDGVTIGVIVAGTEARADPNGTLTIGSTTTV